LRELERANGVLPRTVEALTGGGGRHVYFSHPGGEIPCSAGKLGPGLDIRSDGGYRQLCLLPDPPISDDLFGALLVRGTRTVLGAHTGEGKTTVALEMTAAVAQERECLGFTGAGGRVLVIDAEQGLRTITRRLRETGLEKADNVDYLRVPDGLALDQDGADTVQLEALLDSGDYSLVVADPLYKLHRGDSNEERHAVDLMRRLDRWRDQHRFALLMLVHLRKPPPLGAKFSLHEFFGSGAYLRGAEVAIGIRRMTPGYSRLHFFKERDGDLPVGGSWGLVFDRKDGFRRDPDDGKDRETALNKVRNALEDRPSPSRPPDTDPGFER